MTLVLMAIMIFYASAQQSMFGGTEIIFPEIHEDYTVTFRVQAPEAEEVKLTGGSTSLSLHHYYLNKNMKLSYLFMILLLGSQWPRTSAMGSIRKAERAGDAAG